MGVKAASKEKYAALRRKRRRLRSVGLRPRAMGALRGLAVSLRRLQKSIPLDAFGTRGSGEGSLRGSASGGSGLRPSSRLRPAPLRPPFPLPPPKRSSANQPPTLRAVHAPSAEDVHRGAPTLLSEMHAQFLREESWLRFAAQAGRGSAPVPAFALSLRPPPASRPQPAGFAPPLYAVPPQCRPQSLRRFFEFFISCCA